MNLRVVSKFLFLVVIIGVFMPMCCDMNGLELANSGYISSDGVFAIYAIFISAIIGLILGFLIVAKVQVNIAIDWMVVVFNFFTTVIAFFVAGVVNGNMDYFQSGPYVILVGAILVMITQIASKTSQNNNRNNSYSGTKKCPFCANEIKREAIVCQFCGKDLPVESNTAPINRNYGDTWVCKKCNERNPITSSSCKGCGAYK